MTRTKKFKRVQKEACQNPISSAGFDTPSIFVSRHDNGHVSGVSADIHFCIYQIIRSVKTVVATLL